MSIIGERIKATRKKEELTQKEFSKRILVTPSYLSRVENGSEKPTDMLVKLISLEFNVPLNWLKGETDTYNFDGDYFDRGNNTNAEGRELSLNNLNKHLNNIALNEVDGEVLAVVNDFIATFKLSDDTISSKNILVLNALVGYLLDNFQTINRFENIDTLETLEIKKDFLKKSCVSSAEMFFDEMYSILKSTLQK